MPVEKSKEIIVNDVEVDVDDIDFLVVDAVQAEYEDNRNYVDKCFQSFSPERGDINKTVRRVVCVDNEEPEVKPGELVAIMRYKAKPAKGRKSPLAGYDVLHVPLPTGSLRIPLDQAEQFGKYLIGAARSVLKTNENQTNDNIEVK